MNRAASDPVSPLPILMRFYSKLRTAQSEAWSFTVMVVIQVGILCLFNPASLIYSAATGSLVSVQNLSTLLSTLAGLFTVAVFWKRYQELRRFRVEENVMRDPPADIDRELIQLLRPKLENLALQANQLKISVNVQDQQSGASAMEGGGRLNILLGLGFLNRLRSKAVLAHAILFHEIGHFYQRDTRRWGMAKCYFEVVTRFLLPIIVPVSTIATVLSIRNSLTSEGQVFNVIAEIVAALVIGMFTFGLGLLNLAQLRRARRFAEENSDIIGSLFTESENIKAVLPPDTFSTRFNILSPHPSSKRRVKNLDRFAKVSEYIRSRAAVGQMDTLFKLPEWKGFYIPTEIMKILSVIPLVITVVMLIGGLAMGPDDWNGPFIFGGSALLVAVFCLGCFMGLKRMKFWAIPVTALTLALSGLILSTGVVLLVLSVASDGLKDTGMPWWMFVFCVVVLSVVVGFLIYAALKLVPCRKLYDRTGFARFELRAIEDLAPGPGPVCSEAETLPA